jgi:very-short-patch-repair endonuclease
MVRNMVMSRTRARFLEAKGSKVIRFWDNEVLQQPDAVLEAILDSVGDRTLTPTPLPKGDGA